MNREILAVALFGVTLYALFSNKNTARKRMKVSDIVPGGHITSKYGYRTLSGKREFHSGLDIAAPIGTPIYSPVAGTLYLIRPGSPTAGNYVTIRTADGRYYRFLHMDRIEPDLRRGDKIRQGQKIGYVGNTGRSTGAHLHIDTYTTTRPDGYPADLTDPNDTLNLY